MRVVLRRIWALLRELTGDDAYERYVATRRRIEAGELGWDALADFFTDDATYRWHPWDTGDDVAHPVLRTDQSLTVAAC